MIKPLIVEQVWTVFTEYLLFYILYKSHVLSLWFHIQLGFWKTFSMMKQFFVFALIFGIALGMPEKLSEKEFEEKFNELVDPILEEKAGEELAKEEEEIEKQNEAFAKGEANFGKCLRIHFEIFLVLNVSWIRTYWL